MFFFCSFRLVSNLADNVVVYYYFFVTFSRTFFSYSVLVVSVGLFVFCNLKMLSTKFISVLTRNATTTR